MIILIHKNVETPVKAITLDGEDVFMKSVTCTGALWELAGRFPEEVIGWCEEKYVDLLLLNNWDEIFHHNLIMASYAVENTFLPESIGYVDQLPFVNVNRKVLYATWQMSSDVGGIHAEALQIFYPLFKNINGFNFLLNSIAKLGQQNGLFCYSAPKLVTLDFDKKLKSLASAKELFSFVYGHYNSIWTILLLWCSIKYDKKFPVYSCFQSLLKKKYFSKTVDLSAIAIDSTRIFEEDDSIDVIIPTMGRTAHLLQVMEDLSHQTLLPSKVVVVEQDPAVNSVTQLEQLNRRKWPFEIMHYFIHQSGACNARNLALKEVNSSWVFFCDDDNRIKPQVLETTLKEMRKYGVEVLNTAYPQPGDKVVFKQVKQWGTFGSGNGMVRKSLIGNSQFSPIFEHGYGEDIDFGMQLRNKGCDIIYHPGIEILHLKAPMGGFREKPELEWERSEPLPKPSPTLMAYALQYYTMQQIKGFKNSLFIKYFGKQKNKNPVTYLQDMRRRWQKSEKWAKRLINSSAGKKDKNSCPKIIATSFRDQTT